MYYRVFIIRRCAAFLRRKEACAHLNTTGSPFHEADDISMRVNAAGHNYREIAVFPGHVLYRRQKIFQFVRVKIHLVDLEAEMTSGKGPLQDNGIRPVAEPLPLLADQLQRAGRGDDRDKGCVTGRLNGRQPQRQSCAGYYEVRTCIDGSPHGLLIVSDKGHHDVDSDKST